MFERPERTSSNRGCNAIRKGFSRGDCSSAVAVRPSGARARSTRRQISRSSSDRQGLGTAASSMGVAPAGHTSSNTQHLHRRLIERRAPGGGIRRGTFRERNGPAAQRWDAVARATRETQANCSSRATGGAVLTSPASPFSFSRSVGPGISQQHRSNANRSSWLTSFTPPIRMGTIAGGQEAQRKACPL
eukprot:scaffold7344_cov127-Isochrysis_galbana.AAC.6